MGTSSSRSVNVDSSLFEGGLEDLEIEDDEEGDGDDDGDEEGEEEEDDDEN